MKLLNAFLPVFLLGGLAVSSSKPVESALAGDSKAESYAVDASHSSLTFRTLHLGVSMFHGRFNQIAGELTYVEGDPSASSASIVVKAESVDTNNGGRDKHLRSNDFFSVKEFPEIRFDSTKISVKGKQVEITGELELHGVTQTIEAKGEIIGKQDMPDGAHKMGVEVNFEIDMADYDIAMVKKAPGAVGPLVYLTLSLECDRK